MKYQAKNNKYFLKELTSNLIYNIIFIVNAMKKRSNSIPFIRRELDKVKANIKYTMNNTLECLGEYVSNLSRDYPLSSF